MSSPPHDRHFGPTDKCGTESKLVYEQNYGAIPSIYDDENTPPPIEPDADDFYVRSPQADGRSWRRISPRLRLFAALTAAVALAFAMRDNSPRSSTMEYTESIPRLGAMRSEFAHSFTDPKKDVGGFSPVAPSDPGVQAAALYAAVDSYASLPANSARLGPGNIGYLVLSASLQVVAGLNYHLIMEITVEGKCVEVHDVIVYRSLGGDLSVSKREVEGENECSSVAEAATDVRSAD